MRLERKNWDRPQPAVEKLDLSADTAVRISGKDDYFWEPFWLAANEFLCVMQKENENRASIYRMSLDSKNPKLLVNTLERRAQARRKTDAQNGTVMLSEALQRNAKHEARLSNISDPFPE